MGERPGYAPIPARAMGDDRLAGADLKVLMAIAAHDRFGNNGTGCFASHARLASLTKLHEKAVARSIGRLRDAGYLTVERNPMNARLAVYRIVYLVEDHAVMRGDGRPHVRAARPRAVATGNNAATSENESEPNTGSNLATDKVAIGNNPIAKAEGKQGAPSHNIFCEADNRLREARFEKGENDPPQGTRAAAQAARDRAEADQIAPNEVDAVLKKLGEGIRASPALLQTTASQRARGAA